MRRTYDIVDGKTVYVPNKIIGKDSDLLERLSNLSKRHENLKTDSTYWKNILRIDNSINGYIREFLRGRGSLEVDVPLLTRSISSPGSLLQPPFEFESKPFSLKLFGRDTFLSQSSQLYLEAYLIAVSDRGGVFTIGKSFRNEETDFRHLAEFRHVEFEAPINFDDNIMIQESMVKYIIDNLLEKDSDCLGYFISDGDIEALARLKIPFDRIDYDYAMKVLRRNPEKNDHGEFGMYDEIKLMKLLDIHEPINLCHFPEMGVSFYHSAEKSVAKNSDCLFPGFGEIIGSGERILSEIDYDRKSELFPIDEHDYGWYRDIREMGLNEVTHSGFGMGLERFMCALLGLPSLSCVVAFPRLSTPSYP